jgi:hypothetical protein
VAHARGRFTLWWLGSFSVAGAIVGPLTFVSLLGGKASFAILAIAILGAIVGCLLALGIAQAIVVVADEIELSENPRFPRLGRLLHRLDDLLDKIRP